MDSSFAMLVRALSRLPGLGARSAERAAMALVRNPDGLARDLAEALDDARRDIHLCGKCGAVTSSAAGDCGICSNPMRDASRICVVEEPGDIEAIEKSGAYNGVYHALLGKLSAHRGISPDDRRIEALMRRVEAGGVAEVIIATSTDVEGDATAALLAERIARCAPAGAEQGSVKVTRLAFGLPAGSGVGYSDPLTLRRAIAGRFSLE